MKVQGEHDAIHVLCELLRVSVGANHTRLDSFADRETDDVDPVALQLNQSVAHGSRAIVQLGGRGDEDAAARQRDVVFPFEPALEQRAQPRRTARLLQGGADHHLRKPARRVVQDVDLECFFGLEVREQAALGEVECVSENADRKSGKAHLAGEAGGMIENRGAGPFALVHGRQE